MLISETLDLASRVTETLSQDHLKILREAGCISMNAEGGISEVPHGHYAQERKDQPADQAGPGRLLRAS